MGQCKAGAQDRVWNAVSAVGVKAAVMFYYFYLLPPPQSR